MDHGAPDQEVPDQEVPDQGVPSTEDLHLYDNLSYAQAQVLYVILVHHLVKNRLNLYFQLPMKMK